MEKLIKAAEELKSAAEALLEIATKPAVDPAQLVREYLESDQAKELINRWQSLHFEKKIGEEVKKCVASLQEEIEERIEEEIKARVHDSSYWDNLDPEQVEEAISKIQEFPDARATQSSVDKMEEYPDADDVQSVVDDFRDVENRAAKIEAIAEALEPLVQAVDNLKPVLKAVS